MGFVLAVGCGLGPSAEGRSPEDLDATVSERVEATIASTGYLEPTPPIPSPTSDVLRAKETPTATPAVPTFEELRTQATGFLQQINSISNSYFESLKNSSVSQNLSSEDIFAVNNALVLRVQITQGAISRLDQVDPVPEISETGEFLDMFVELFDVMQRWQVDHRNAVLSGDSETALKLENENPFDFISDAFERSDEIQEQILATFNIPDSEVRYLRVGAVPANETEWQTVQAAMDLYIADQNLRTVPASTVPANDFTISELFPRYLRVDQTLCSYTWDTAGKVTQVAC